LLLDPGQAFDPHACVLRCLERCAS
jgi:hypothetical protein